MDKQTILKKHHDMWMYIAEVLRTNKEWQERYFRDPDTTIGKLKQIYVTGHEPLSVAYKLSTNYAACYCCYYTSPYRCTFCPVVWGKDGLGCMSGSSEYRMVVRPEEYGIKNIDTVIDLCIKIANLPERKGV